MPSKPFTKKISKKLNALLLRKPAKQNYGLFWQNLLAAHRSEWAQARQVTQKNPLSFQSRPDRSCP